MGDTTTTVGGKKAATSTVTTSQARRANRERPWDCRNASYPPAEAAKVHERGAKPGLLANTRGTVERGLPTAWGKAG